MCLPMFPKESEICITHYLRELFQILQKSFLDNSADNKFINIGMQNVISTKLYFLYVRYIDIYDIFHFLCHAFPNFLDSCYVILAMINSEWFWISMKSHKSSYLLFIFIMQVIDFYYFRILMYILLEMLFFYIFNNGVNNVEIQKTRLIKFQG